MLLYGDDAHAIRILCAYVLLKDLIRNPCLKMINTSAIKTRNKIIVKRGA